MACDHDSNTISDLVYGLQSTWDNEVVRRIDAGTGHVISPREQAEALEFCLVEAEDLVAALRCYIAQRQSR